MVSATEGCTGEDPALVPGSSTGPSDADSGAGSESGASTDADVQAPANGVFLTSKRLPPDFLASVGGLDGGDDVNAGAAAAFVDGWCRSAASEAGLPMPERYLAVVTTSPSITADYNRLLAVSNVPPGRWCPIDPKLKRPSCSDERVIFRSAEDFRAGPLSAITTDERGLASSNLSGAFWSGLFYPPGAANEFDIETLNCASWSTSVPQEDGEAHPHRGGVGRAGAREHADGGTLPLAWLAAEERTCSDDNLYALLCIQVPAP